MISHISNREEIMFIKTNYKNCFYFRGIVSVKILKIDDIFVLN